MTFTKYLKDKMYVTIISVFLYLIFLLLMLAFKVDISLIIVMSSLLIFTYVLLLIIDYCPKKKFYDSLFEKTENLDKSYLVMEMIEKPSFYEGEILYQVMCDVNKSMIEEVNMYKHQTEDFKEFIEMWIHEVKIPISSIMLLSHNHKDKVDAKMLEQVKRIENYVELVLYYARQDCAEADYLIKKVELSRVISNVMVKHKDEFLNGNIDLEIEEVGNEVYTDSKWLEFILGQIVNNSIKYRKDNDSSYIKIFCSEEADTVKLIIEDNGIGIKSSEIGRVFDKSFTGSNGRVNSVSTGMGLYICKNLCKKLGHRLEIESTLGEYTRVIISFAKNKYYDEVK